MITEMKIALDCHTDILRNSLSCDANFCITEVFKKELEKDIVELSKISVELNFVIRHLNHCLKNFKPTTDIMSPMGLSENMRALLLIFGYPTLNIEEETIEDGKKISTFLPFFMKLPDAPENTQIEITSEDET